MASSGVATWIAWLMLLLLTSTASVIATTLLKPDWTSVLKTNVPNMLRLLPPNGDSLMPSLSLPMASFTMLLIGSSTDCVDTSVRLGHFPTVWSKNMPVPAFPSPVPAVSPPAFVVHAPPLQSPLIASPPGLMVLVWASISRNSAYSHVSSPPPCTPTIVVLSVLLPRPSPTARYSPLAPLTILVISLLLQYLVCAVYVSELPQKLPPNPKFVSVGPCHNGDLATVK